MLMRCYSKKYHCKQPTYVGCSVCEEWLTFSNFAVWMESKKWEGKHLDKDLIDSTNKVYSPKTCMFIQQGINNLFTDHGAARGEHPTGVSFHKASGKFTAQLSGDGGLKYLGLFETPEEAHASYTIAKVAYVHNIVLSLSDSEDARLGPALQRWCDSQNTCL